MTEECRKCVNAVTNVLTAQHLTLLYFFFPFFLQSSFVFSFWAHPRNLTFLSLLLGDSVLKREVEAAEECQAANTFSLLVEIQEETVVSSRLPQMPLKGKSAF